MKPNLMKFLLLPFLCISYSLSAQNYKPLILSEIKADGWIRSQIARDWTSGNFSVLYNNSFFTTTLGPIKSGSNVSTKFRDDSGRWVYTWDWNEMEGNLADGAVRAGFLSDNATIKTRFKTIMDFMVDSVAATQYVDSLAYSNIGGGELFGQTTVERAMLAYYEYTGNVKYLNAVVKLVDKTIIHWNKKYNAGETYFGRPFAKKGAMYHSLTYGDILEYLYRINPDRKYVDFAFRLYYDFTKNLDLVGNADDGGADATLDILANPSASFLGHGPHTAEQLRMPLWLAGFTKDSVQSIQTKFQQAIANIPIKLYKSLSPSKGLVTDPAKFESVNGKTSSGNLKYEYCSLTETLNSLSSMSQKFAVAESAENTEILFFNAAQGARFADGKANTYLIADNMQKALLADGWRDQYAALHGIRCCNLNACRIAPYYVANMWMKSQDEKEIIAMLHGPSQVQTKLNGVNVKIIADTNYPFENTIRYTITPDSPVDFTLVVRNPSWSKNTNIIVNGATIELLNGFYRIKKTWASAEKISIAFEDKIELKKLDTSDSKDFYIQRGALLYTYPYENAKTSIVVRSAFPSFSNWDIQIPSTSTADYAAMNMHTDSKTMFARDSSFLRYQVSTPYISDYPYDFPRGKITGRFVVSGNIVERDLLPMGCATTRRTTYSTSSTLNTILPVTIELQGLKTVNIGESTQFSALVKNQFNIAMSNPSLTWSVINGTITQQGYFTATTANTTAIVSVKCGAITSNFAVKVSDGTAINLVKISPANAYPTLTNGDIFFHNAVKSIAVFTLDGRKMSVIEDLPAKINISHLPNGYYLMKLDGEIVKIIKN